MKRGAWCFVLLLLSAVFCVSAIPQTDLPETSYNEVDTPVNQAPPVVSGLRIVRPAVTQVTMSKQVCEALRETSAQRHTEFTACFPVQSSSNSLQDLLCTLLI
jgi:hypothetical protein